MKWIHEPVTAEDVHPVTPSPGPPGATDDAAAGHILGDHWITDDGSVYQAIDVTVGAAVWRLLGGGIEKLWDADGPADEVTGAFFEVVGNPFPITWTWYTDATKTKKVIEKTATRNQNQTPATLTWRQYAMDGLTIIKTVVDTLVYDGVFEITRTRVVT